VATIFWLTLPDRLTYPFSMKKPILAGLLLAVLAFMPAGAQDGAPDPLQFGLEHLTEHFGLNTSDIAFRSDYTEPDSLRLKLIADLMQRPLGMIDYVGSLKTAHVNGQPEILAGALFSDLVLEHQESRGRPYQPAIEEIQNRYTLAYADPTLNGLLFKAANYLDAVLPGSTDRSLAGLTQTQRAFLTNQLREVVLDDVGAELLSVEEVDSLSDIEERYIEEFIGFAHNIRKDPIVAAGIDCLRDIMPDIRAIRSALSSGQVSGEQMISTTGFLPEGENPDFLGIQPGWKIGGVGNDYYKGEYSFILDLGGDDVYDLEYDPTNPHGVVIIDLSGHDLYRAGTDFALGSGCLSVGLLLDFGGNDRYDSRSFALGSGYFGFGLLYDADGDDRYNGDTHVQGAGTFGIGLLIDEGGTDVYHGAMYAQGFGFVQGAGLIFEKDGSDIYYAGGKYKDINRYLDHYISMSQGFSYGIRPYFSGGIGGIIDLEGNDNYQADIYGQGGAYWWGLGLLYDSSGLDRYNCHQYAHGSGTHMALGILIDDHGNDSYMGDGVLQGCGHDYACGILIDREGDDVYVGRGKVQGDGSANGIGILMDLAGADRYYSPVLRFCQGAGDPRRGFGSIGLFIDLGGEDHYAGNGRNNHYWTAEARWGGGMDIELNPPDTTGGEDE
jgi:hypothetical protein